MEREIICSSCLLNACPGGVWWNVYECYNYSLMICAFHCFIVNRTITLSSKRLSSLEMMHTEMFVLASVSLQHCSDRTNNAFFISSFFWQITNQSTFAYTDFICLHCKLIFTTTGVETTGISFVTISLTVLTFSSTKFQLKKHKVDSVRRLASHPSANLCE